MNKIHLMYTYIPHTIFDKHAIWSPLYSNIQAYVKYGLPYTTKEIAYAKFITIYICQSIKTILNKCPNFDRHKIMIIPPA